MRARVRWAWQPASESYLFHTRVCAHPRAGSTFAPSRHRTIELFRPHHRATTSSRHRVTTPSRHRANTPSRPRATTPSRHRAITPLHPRAATPLYPRAATPLRPRALRVRRPTLSPPRVLRDRSASRGACHSAPAACCARATGVCVPIGAPAQHAARAERVARRFLRRRCLVRECARTCMHPERVRVCERARMHVCGCVCVCARVCV